MEELQNITSTPAPSGTPTEAPTPAPVAPVEPFDAWVLDDAGLIVNRIRVTSLDAIPGLRLVDSVIGGKMGDQIDFDEEGQPVLVPAPIDPVPRVIPDRVTMRQARLALLETGLLDEVDAAILGMQGVEGKAARIEWDYSQEVWRTKPLVAVMAQVLNLSDAQLDDLFSRAGEL